MKKFIALGRQALPHTLVIIALASFIVIFASYHPELGTGVASLATIPVVVAGWYFGVRGGMVIAFASIVIAGFLLSSAGHPVSALAIDPGNILRAISLLLVAVVTGRLSAITHERRDAFVKLARSNELTYSLLHVVTHIENALGPAEIIQALGDELRDINLSCGIALVDTDRKVFTMQYLSLDQKQLDTVENILGFSLDNFRFSPLVSEYHIENVLQPAVMSSLRAELQIVFSREEAASILNNLVGGESSLDVEIVRLLLMFEENLLGILWVWGSAVSTSDLPVMSIFAKQIGISLERARLFQEVQNLAITDPLTGLHNRRSLFELGRIEFSRAERLSRPFSCLMMDFDHFKQINDTYGHPTGDKVLRGFARLCKESVREIDLIGRYGGEELMILMPETEIEMATQVAERLRVSVCENQMTVDDQVLNVTVSIGVATKDENTLELDTLIARADQAMYIAKHRGRNCVAVSK